MVDPMGRNAKTFDIDLKHYQKLLDKLREGTKNREEIVAKIRKNLDRLWDKMQKDKNILEEIQKKCGGDSCGYFAAILFLNLFGGSINLSKEEKTGSVYVDPDEDIQMPVFFAHLDPYPHVQNAIFIGPNFSPEELGKWENWVFIELSISGIFITDPKYLIGRDNIEKIKIIAPLKFEVGGTEIPTLDLVPTSVNEPNKLEIYFEPGKTANEIIYQGKKYIWDEKNKKYKRPC